MHCVLPALPPVTRGRAQGKANPELRAHLSIGVYRVARQTSSVVILSRFNITLACCYLSLFCSRFVDHGTFTGSRLDRAKVIACR